MSKMATTTIFLLCLVAFSAVYASNVPVLMWSPERPLSDLPQAPSSDSIAEHSFHANYLKPLLEKEANVLVAFLQDKLHVSDISKYADVYSQNSDGGAFKNIKGLLDEHFSLELPAVSGSHLALDKLRQGFTGAVHDLAAAADLEGLDLTKGKHLVIVRLQPVATARNEEAAIKSNDEVVGQVSRHLSKRSVKYTALYTAESAEAAEDSAVYQGRHLLATADAQPGGVFYNVSYGNGSLYAYLTSVSVCVISADRKAVSPCSVNFTIPASELTTLSDMTVTAGENRTLMVSLVITGFKANSTGQTYDLTLNMPFQHHYDRYEIKDATLTLKNGTAGVINNKVRVITQGYDSIVPILYSFHCSSFDWYVSGKANQTKTKVTLGGFQIQPFNTTGDGFRMSVDCVGWFSTAIWMSLVPVFINIVILLFGMYMLSSLTTNDRFDDPKGKPLNINAGE